MTPDEFKKWQEDKLRELNEAIDKVAKKEGWGKQPKVQSFEETKAKEFSSIPYVPDYSTPPKKKHQSFSEWQGK
ncbi:MAG: hypothetical protein KJI70_00715 [Patescibacteria group bacterium]|nr:hypothetical protein [Patescibacteria group bacterium]